MDVLMTIIIIILIIIGIVLFIFLVAEVEFPPPQFVAPFRSGTTVRIKSLANNKYIRLAQCSSSGVPNYTQCMLTPAQGWGGCTNPSFHQLVADGEIGSNNINWNLCEYVGKTVTPGMNAVYVLFQGVANSELVMSYSVLLHSTDIAPLQVTPNTNTCALFNQNYGHGLSQFSQSVYFSFMLQENGSVGTNEGIYQIVDGNPKVNPTPGIFLDTILTCSGVKDISLYSTCTNPTTCIPANNCPVLLEMRSRSAVLLQDPLTYSFVIETVQTPT